MNPFRFQTVPTVIVEAGAARRLGALLRRGKEAGLVREDLSPEQFYFGLAVVTRPLPETVTQTMPVDLSWLVSAYFHGLRP